MMPTNGANEMTSLAFVLTKPAQPMGQYRPTTIDAAKAAADFLVTAVGRRNTITWRDGRTELVNDAKLARLQSAHTWATDF